MNIQKKQPPGLTNTGANCYLNSALQGLSACEQFIKEVKRISDEMQNNGGVLRQLTEFKNLLTDLSQCQTNRMSISSNSIFRDWRKCGQQDSFELFSHIVNVVFKELRKYKEGKEEIKKKDIQSWLSVQLPLRILIQYEIRCLNSCTVNSPTQCDLALHVPIPLKQSKEEIELQNLLDRFFDVEGIDGYECDQPGCLKGPVERIAKLIQPLPTTLCIHLQRTYWNGYRMEKIDSHVRFTETLVIKREFTSCFEDKSASTDRHDTQEDDRYQLVSVIVHFGSTNFGHYICFKRVDNEWFRTNDSSVSIVSFSDIVKSEAYILFYEKPP